MSTQAKMTKKKSSFKDFIAGENEGDSEDSWASEICGHESEDSEASQGQEEESATTTSPKPHINHMAIADIAFKVEPKKDGIVRHLQSLPPMHIPLTPNYYRYLTEETGTHRWSWPRNTSPVPTNSQRLAHPWKLRRKERNN
jgi:hypothetical protein